MRAEPICPRCFGPLHAPSVWSSAWRCGLHGDVLPLQPPRKPSRASLLGLRQAARVPIWLQWPLPAGWLVTGFAEAGDERSGARATVVALSGPSVTHGPADLLIVAEEPGVGLGAGLAGLDGPDPGEGFDKGPSHAKVMIRGHPTPLWFVDGATDRAAYAGEALGDWLWLIAWPAEVGCLIALDELTLRDLCDTDQDLDLPYGAFSPRLPGAYD
ncbi:DUF6758 family protein [Thermostaphylospora chromogena]|uniref:Phosphotransacetylase n=1 Tax=Thermostaphylospora chromogena TaxID=35622 RepID=A0A1H1AYR6_9ACTN|nr:DUF6758 family protein [Thermostaphylospora chromogena]SDQ44783.1 hypothetical protein SAMN04489764_0714 [Thermostaphylospora chromogena]